MTSSCSCRLCGFSLIFLRPPVHNMQSQTTFNLDLSVYKYKLSVVWERAGLLEPLFCGRFSMTLKKIMIISASKERADNMSIFLQKLIIETPWLSHLRPKSDDSRWSRISFDVNCAPHQAPSVKSVGITGQLTGSRADIMILDDIEVPGNSLSETMREKLLQLCTEAESILTPKDDSRIMFLGTPQTTFTVYRKLAERAYKPFVWPARYPRKVSQYEGLLAPQLVADIDNGAKSWEVTDPDRFADDDLLERKQPWDAATSCCSLCSIQAYPMQKNSHLKWLTLSLQASTLILLLTASSGAQTPQTSSKNYRLSDYLEIISTVQCAYKESGILTKRQSARLTRRVEEQMRRLQLLSVKETVSCTCTKCVLTETDTLTTRSWTY